jgi:hypothetical protein
MVEPTGFTPKRNMLKTFLLGALALFGVVCLFQSGAIGHVRLVGHHGLAGEVHHIDEGDLQEAMENMLHVMKAMSNPLQLKEALQNSPMANEPEVKAMLENPEQLEQELKAVRELAGLVALALQQVQQEPETAQGAVDQMQKVLDQAHEMIHVPGLRKLLLEAQAAQQESGRKLLDGLTAAQKLQMLPLVMPLFAERADGFQVPAMTAGARARTAAPTMQAMDNLKTLAKELNPVVGYWDPLNLAGGEFWDQSQEATIGFLRHAEIKHGRVAMAAFVGYCVQSNFHFPWKLTGEISFDDIAAAGGPPDQWDALPTNAKLQIILFIGFLEFWSENNYVLASSGQTHYMRGGKPGAFPSLKKEIPHPIPFELFDPFNLQKNKSDEWKAEKLRTEINNGRLAMLGIMAFLAESKVPGSVPALGGLGIAPYSGEVMAPFSSGDVGLPFVSGMLESNPIGSFR